jgi:hypothetical protein
MSNSSQRIDENLVPLTPDPYFQIRRHERLPAAPALFAAAPLLSKLIAHNIRDSVCVAWCASSKALFDAQDRQRSGLALAGEQRPTGQDLRTDATYSRGTIYRAPTNGDLDVNLRKS